MIEHFFTCPHCWQQISMLIDNSISKQSFIEDCEVCCNPLELNVAFNDKELLSFDVKKSQ